MAAPGTAVTVKQKAVIDAHFADPMKSQLAIANELGVARETVAKALQSQTALDLARRKNGRHGDKARDLAASSMRVASIAIETVVEDPLKAMQVAHGGITVAAKHAEAFEASETPQDQDEHAAALQLMLLRSAVAGALWCMSRSDPRAALDKLKARLPPRR